MRLRSNYATFATMSNIIPRKEFAEKCGIANNILPVQVDRGKLVMQGTRCSKCENKPRPCRDCSNREYVDLDYRTHEGHYINLDFYKRYAKKENIPLPVKVKSKPVKEKPVAAPVFVKPVTISKETSTPPKEENFEDLSELSSDDRLTRAKKFREIQNKEADIRLKELQEAKLRGELIPIDIVRDIIQFLGENQKRAYLDAGENLIMVISERLQAQEHDKAFMRAKLIEGTNRAINNSVNESQKKLDQFMPYELQEDAS